ncbi:hypothetical protein, partial [Neobacillus sp. CF12]|uniref:hypothetical protein n=1 Tax=Neobacillus sp. CF12 TaxID=3055864 RepID=UPI0025A2E77B
IGRCGWITSFLRIMQSLWTDKKLTVTCLFSFEGAIFTVRIRPEGLIRNNFLSKHLLLLQSLFEDVILQLVARQHDVKL